MSARRRHTATQRLLLTLLGVLALASGPRAQGVLLTTIAPASGSYGESVTVTGAGFGGPGMQVRVGGVSAPVVSATGSRVTFRVPLGVPIGPTTVTVTNPGGRSASAPFEVSGRVSLTFDEDRRREAIVGPAGGVISTQSDGRTFTLTIPAGALTAPETIVLTPVAEIAGFPLERALGIVHFAPEGLQFLLPATLTVTLAPDADTRGLIGVSAAGNGENLHLVPFTVTGDGAISLPIPHFTLGGFGGGSMAAINSVFCLQNTIECRYANALAQAEAQAVQSVCGAGCTSADLIEHADAIHDAVGAAYIPLFGQWFDEVLNFLDTAGAADDDGLGAAGREFLAWRAYLEASACSSTVDCQNVATLAADREEGEAAFGRGYAAALQRAADGCNDRHVFALMMQIAQLSLFNNGGLPADAVGIRERFACQMVLTPSFPASVNFNDVVPFSVTIGVRPVGGGAETPRTGVRASLEISDGCGEFNGGGRVMTASTDGNGRIATTVRTGNPCNGAQNATEIRVTAFDIESAPAEVEALGRSATARAAMGVTIVVTPQNATVNAGETITFTAQVTGAGPLVRWTASGGSITPGPSATAVYTAGSNPGTFGVTATSADAPTESQTIAVTINNSEEPAVIIRGLMANVRIDAAGACEIRDNDGFFGIESSCPAGTWDAPAGFTDFREERAVFTKFEPDLGNVGRAQHFAALYDDEITSSGLTQAFVSWRDFYNENGEPDRYFPTSHAAGIAELQVEVEVRGAPAKYVLDGWLWHDDYPWFSANGHAAVSIQFADVDIAEIDYGRLDFSRRGTLSPGRYLLKFKADADMVKNAGSMSFNTQWSFRLRIDQ